LSVGIAAGIIRGGGERHWCLFSCCPLS